MPGTASKDSIFFVSDAHIGAPVPGYEKREPALVQFLRSIQDSASKLFIVGDLFDFWIEYRHAIRPDYFPILHELRSLVERGVEIHYMAGNHDFALGSFLTETLGITIHTDHFEAMLQGKRVHLYHGDGMIKADHGYRILRRILRNPLNQRIYRLLHPDIGVPLGSIVSGSSRKMLALRVNEQRKAEYRERGHDLLKAGADIAVFGHTHQPEIVQWGDKVYCNTGEWIRRYTYARMDRGIISLLEYRSDGTSQVIPAKSM